MSESGPPTTDVEHDAGWRNTERATQRAELLAAAHMAQRLDAGHDANGNPRRVWLVYDEGGTILDAVDEEYAGMPAALRELGLLVLLPEVPTTASFWRSMLRTHGTGLLS